MKLSVTVILLTIKIGIIAQTPSYVPTDSLMGWWPFNNNAIDESVNTNNGTVNGPTITTDCLGSPNSAYDFDGLNDGISIPALNLLSSDEMSISVWVRPTNFSAHGLHEIVRQDNGYTISPDFLLSFQNFGSMLSFGIRTASYSELDVSIISSVYLNNWEHIVAVYDGNQRFIYKNAVLIGSDSKSGSITYTSSIFTVGCEPTYSEPQEFFDGKIDDLGIWRRALTEQEIMDLYNGGLSTIINDNTSSHEIIVYPNPSSGILYLKANEESHIEIYSLLGSKIGEYKLVSGENKLDLNSLSRGQYILKMFNKKNELGKIEKIIIGY